MEQAGTAEAAAAVEAAAAADAAAASATTDVSRSADTTHPPPPPPPRKTHKSSSTAAATRRDTAPATTPRPRLALVGCAGAGKSRLAAELSARLEVTHIDLDHLFWAEGEARPEGFAARLRQARKAAEGSDRMGGWVIEGNYKVAKNEAWGRADVVLHLEPPPWRRLLRVCKRELRRWWLGLRNNRGEVTALWRLAWWLVVDRKNDLVRHALGLDAQARQLMANLQALQAELHENHRQACAKREAQRAQGRLAKETLARESVPVVRLTAESDVRAWVEATCTAQLTT